MTEVRETETSVIVAAMRILAREIVSGDGVANAAIDQAALRLEEQAKEIELLKEELSK